MPQLRTIDIDTASLNAPAPAQDAAEEDNDDYLLHPRADAAPAQPPPAPVFVPAQ
jgi:hypothetical protein